MRSGVVGGTAIGQYEPSTAVMTMFVMVMGTLFATTHHSMLISGAVKGV